MVWEPVFRIANAPAITASGSSISPAPAARPRLVGPKPDSGLGPCLARYNDPARRKRPRTQPHDEGIQSLESVPSPSLGRHESVSRLGSGARGFYPLASTSATRLFRNLEVDFRFINADHVYKNVLSDLRAWWLKIRPGGNVAGYDYHQQAPWLLGVTATVHEFFKLDEAVHPMCPYCWVVTKKLDRQEAFPVPR